MTTVTTTLRSEGTERTVRHNTDENNTYIDVSLTGKEAIDVINALKHLLDRVKNDDSFETELPVEDTYHTVLGGMSFPTEFNVLVSTPDDARVLIDALQEYSPPNGEKDNTPVVLGVLLDAMDRSPVSFPVDELRDR